MNNKEELKIKKEIMTKVQYKLKGGLILRYDPKDGKKYFEYYSHLPTAIDLDGNMSSKEIEIKTERYELRSAIYQFPLNTEILDNFIQSFNIHGDEINYFMKFCNPENLIKKVKKEVYIIKYEEKYYKKNKKNKRKQEKLMKKINNLKLKAEILKKKYKKVELN